MGEESIRAEAGGEATRSVDPAAVALALAGASRSKADAFLDDQRAFIAEQRHHLHRQYIHLNLEIWQQRLSVFLRAATLIVGLAIAAACAFFVWSASQSHELIVDAFSVPPDLAQKGLSGEVLAGQLVDRLAVMQARTTSFRALQTYSNSFGERIKLEIPETGISLGELDHFLREKLGDNSHISGALFRTASGLGLTVRVGTEVSDRVDGTEGDLDTLVQRAAEAIYSRTQPFRYATYIWMLGHRDEAHRLLLNLAQTGPSAERSWDYLSVGTSSVDAQGDGASDEAHRIIIGFERRATELNPGNALAWYALANAEELLGHDENALIDYRKSLVAISGAGARLLRKEAVPLLQLEIQARIDGLLSAFDKAAREQAAFSESGLTGLTAGISAMLASYQASGHDAGLAAATLAEPVPEPVTRAMVSARYTRRARIQIALSRKGWNGVLRAAAIIDPREPQQRTGRYAIEQSWIALANAGLGRFTDAEAQIGDMPGDCYTCLIARAQIAEMQSQHARADWWFARADGLAPSLSAASYAWALALLNRGKMDDAITMLRLANRKSPAFADPIESWGEALIVKQQPAAAMAKFEEANRYAPNWGRLHLKWGEALAFAGQRDEAKRQFARAAQLDLTADEKAELGRIANG